MLVALIVVRPLPLPNIVPPNLIFFATARPPAKTTAAPTVLVASVASVNVLTPAIDWLPPSRIPCTVPDVNSLALIVVNPLPTPVNMLVPMLMLPKPVEMLPEFSVPVPVILA